MRLYLDSCCYNRPFDDQIEIDAERFITIIKSDNFDYTEWQRTLWKDRSIDEIHQMATNFEQVALQQTEMVS